MDAWRKIYAPVYGEISHHLAHNKGATEDLDALLAKTNIEEMKRMFGFLYSLHEALRELLLNGRSPFPLPDVTFVLPRRPNQSVGIIAARRSTARARRRCFR